MPVDLAALADRPVRVLVVKLSSFGDVVHVTGVLRAIRRALPRAELTLAVERRWADAVRHDPHLDALVESSARDRVSFDYIAEIRRHLAVRPPFDVAIDLQGNRRSAAWMYLTRAATKVGRGGVRPGWSRVVSPTPSSHSVEAAAEVCRGVGIRVDDAAPCLYPSPIDEAGLDERLGALSVARRGFVILNPFSRWRSKSWPEAAVASFVRRLAANGPPVILTGGEDDRASAARVMASVPVGSMLSVAGRLTLGQALCVFRRARLMISVDSGPMHAAAALGVPVIALFGPTHPERTGPWGPGHIVIQARRPRSHHAYRTDEACEYMRAIDPEVVVVAARAALDAAPACA